MIFSLTLASGMLAHAVALARERREMDSIGMNESGIY